MESINTKDFTKEELLDKVTEKAESLFDSGTYFCSEAVVSTINEFLGCPYDENVVRLSSGFMVGMGKAQCLCGAVSGGQMGLGMAYGRNRGESMSKDMFDKAKGLHDFVKEEYKSTCCRVITKEWAGDNFGSPERKNHCVTITGRVARWVANELINDGKIECKA